MLIYLDCARGLTTAHMLGALLDAGADYALVTRVLAGLTLPRATLLRTHDRYGGIACTVASVALGPVPRDARLLDAIHTLEAGAMPLAVRTWGSGTLRRLAEAEAIVRGVSVDDVPLDDPVTVAEIIAVTAALASLRVVRVYAAPLPSHTAPDDAHAADVVTVLLDEAGWPIATDADTSTGTSTDNGTRNDSGTVTPGGAALLAALCEPGQPALHLRSVGYGGTDIAAPLLACWFGTPYETDAPHTATAATSHPHSHPHGTT